MNFMPNKEVLYADMNVIHPFNTRPQPLQDKL